MYPNLSKKKAAYIRQLVLKKYRLQEHTFVLEGEKSIQELLCSDYKIKFLVGTPSFFKKKQEVFIALDKEVEIFQSSQKVLSSLGYFKYNQDVLAVVEILRTTEPFLSTTGITLALDDIRDPGNLGTIIRIAYWYNITNIICSKTTVDLYNPKVLQASMGAFVQVKLHYINLPLYLEQLQLPIIGATLNGGIHAHKFTFPSCGILVIGNEANGIRANVQKFLTKSVTIARYGKAESLNAAVATAILCDNWSRSFFS